MPCQHSALQRHHPLPGPPWKHHSHRSKVSLRERMTQGEESLRWGCLAHYLQTHNSTSSSVGPICSPGASTAEACPPSQWPDCPQSIHFQSTACTPMSTRRGGPRTGAAAGALHQHASMSGAAAIYEISSKRLAGGRGREAALFTAPVPKAPLFPPLYISAALPNKNTNLNSPDP